MQMLNFTQQVILCGCLLGCIILSAQAVIAGEMTIGGWVAVQAWVTTIYQPLNFLGSIYAAIVQALIDVKNLSEVSPTSKGLSFSLYCRCLVSCAVVHQTALIFFYHNL